MTTEDVDAFARGHHSGKLPSYSEWGAYTIVYVTAGNNDLCADCAMKELELWRQGDSTDPPVSYGTYDEGPPLQCGECNALMESSYGDPTEGDS